MISHNKFVNIFFLLKRITYFKKTLDMIDLTDRCESVVRFWQGYNPETLCASVCFRILRNGC